MAQSESPFSLTDISLLLTLLDADGAPVGTEEEFMCQLNRGELVPSAQSSGSEFETFCANFPPPPKRASWTLELTGFQAYADASDLSLFLFDNELAKARFLLTPRGGVISDTNPAFEGTVTLSPGAIGGTANQYATMTVSLAVAGKPTKLIAPPVPLAQPATTQEQQQQESEQESEQELVAA